MPVGRVPRINDRDGMDRDDPALAGRFPTGVAGSRPALLGLSPEDARSPLKFPDMADEFGHTLPLSLRAFLVRDELAEAVCSMYTSIPPRLELADKDIFPGFEGRPVVNIWAEEQGVCLWGVPLDEGPNPPVLASVAEHRYTYGGPYMYAPSVGHLAVAMAWERAL